MPSPPNMQAMAAMLLVVCALFLFTREKIPLASSALALLIVISLAVLWLPPVAGQQVLTPADLYLGFGNQALIAIVCLMMCAKGLEQTGALHSVARLLGHAWGYSPKLAFLLTLVTAAACSMFMNNTPIVAMLLPLLVTVSMQHKLPSSGILMPVGYATILGGMTTTIGTSTNLLVIGIAQDLGLPAFGMFDFFIPASVGMAAALIFLWLLAPRLIPARQPPMPHTSPRVFDGVIHITEDSKFVGKTFADAMETIDSRVKVHHIERGEGLALARLPTLKLKAGDRLHMRDTPEGLKEAEQALEGKLQLPDHEIEDDDENPKGPPQQLAEVVITSSSYLNGRRLEDLDLSGKFGLRPVALHRPGQEILVNPDEAILRTADILLVQGTLDDIRKWKRSGDILVLDGTLEVPQSDKALLGAGIMAVVVIIAGTGALPISVAAMIGVVAMLISGCLTRSGMKAAIDHSIIMVIAASLALGKFLVVTGAAQYMAELFVYAAAPMSVAIKVSMLMLAMALLTEVVTNNAAAAIGTPIAVSIATTLGAPIEPFLLAVLLGGNMSYMTPMGYQTNLLVMSAGGYRFSDFLRVGIPLQLLVWISLSLSLAWFYDLAW
ncbi:MAG: SLC13 family permease [Gammaproteobacteria bacterium]|nr:SLC13 family permease [Gammaproteobacteria bacterium]